MTFPPTSTALRRMSLRFAILVSLAVPAAAQDLGGIYTSGDGGFSISIPDSPADRRPVASRLGEYRLFGDSYLWADDEEEEIITIEILRVFGSRGVKLSALQKRAVIEAYKKAITGEFAKRGVAFSERPYQFLGTTGVELRSVPPKLVSRILFMNERLVMLGVVRKRDSGAELQLELLDSFRLLPKDQHIAVLIRENTPGDLPQGERAASLPPDTAAMGLKPGVKQVVEFFQTSPAAGRERSREIFFDRAGNLIKEINYASGYPNQIRTWGWADGERVSRSVTINYTPDQAFAPLRPAMIVDGAPGLPEIVDATPGAMNVKPAYGLKYEFKLDAEKRIAERRVISGSGALSFVEKVTYSPAGVETRTTDGTGGFISRVLEVVDKNGLVVEETTLDSHGGRVASRVFTYEFDANGNWTTKRAFSKPQARRTVPDKPLGTYTRVITYH